ncbi:MAG TPA: DUF3089 domain-containing protein [Sphingomicrobium sp.]|nr:DUF3089 domain-containing protein [Sphingomicrobium sp.]
MCARRFLVIVTILTLLAVAGAFAMFQFGGELLKRQMVPQGQFESPRPGSGPDYALPDDWIAHPELSGDPSQWRPSGFSPPDPAPEQRVSAFFIHPTTYLRPDRWNAPLDDPQSRRTAELFVQSQASTFGQFAQVWAPRYRQAAYGAFLLDGRDSSQALDLAYSDIEAAFEEFLPTIPDGQPIILAGHSQGSLHLIRLLSSYGPEIRDRLVAAYVVGWPVSVAADLPAMGLAPCERADQSGCVLSWQSFGEPGNPSIVLDAWVGTRGPFGLERAREHMLCVNPITGTRGGAALPQANRGTLVPSTDMTSAGLEPGRVGARCDNGFLTIGGEIPDIGPFVLPGNNYHVYDYALFWRPVHDDARRRTEAWLKR